MNSGTGVGYFSGKVSATDYEYHSSVYDKSRGSALNFIQDADYYLTNGQIDHSKFYGYTTYEIPDCRYEEATIYRKQIGDNPEDCIYQENPPSDMSGWEVIKYQKEVCGRKTESAVSLNAEVDVLRQAVFELNQQNKILRDELTKIKTVVGIK